MLVLVAVAQPDTGAVAEAVELGDGVMGAVAVTAGDVVKEELCEELELALLRALGEGVADTEDNSLTVTALELEPKDAEDIAENDALVELEDEIVGDGDADTDAHVDALPVFEEKGVSVDDDESVRTEGVAEDEMLIVAHADNEDVLLAHCDATAVAEIIAVTVPQEESEDVVVCVLNAVALSDVDVLPLALILLVTLPLTLELPLADEKGERVGDADGDAVCVRDNAAVRDALCVMRLERDTRGETLPVLLTESEAALETDSAADSDLCDDGLPVAVVDADAHADTVARDGDADKDVAPLELDVTLGEGEFEREVRALAEDESETAAEAEREGDADAVRETLGVRLVDDDAVFLPAVADGDAEMDGDALALGLRMEVTDAVSCALVLRAADGEGVLVAERDPVGLLEGHALELAHSDAVAVSDPTALVETAAEGETVTDGDVVIVRLTTLVADEVAESVADALRETHVVIDAWPLEEPLCVVLPVNDKSPDEDANTDAVPISDGEFVAEGVPERDVRGEYVGKEGCAVPETDCVEEDVPEVVVVTVSESVPLGEGDAVNEDDALGDSVAEGHALVLDDRVGESVQDGECEMELDTLPVRVELEQRDADGVLLKDEDTDEHLDAHDETEGEDESDSVTPALLLADAHIELERLARAVED